jgi:hypothetical protein
MVRCRIRDRKISSVDFLPARCDEHVEPRVLDVDEGRDVVDVIKERLAEFGTQFTEAGDCLEIVRKTAHTEVSKAA